MTVVGDCDIEMIKRDRDQIWAEAIYLFNLMGVAWKPAQILAEEHHRKHMVIDDVMIEKVGEYLQRRDAVEFHLMGDICFGIGLGITPSRTEQLRVGDALRYLGFKKIVKRVNGVLAKVWIKEGIKETHGEQ